MSRRTEWAKAILVTGNTARDGTGTGVLQVFEAEGPCWVEDIQGLPGSDTTLAVLRAFINNGQNRGEAANNILRGEATAEAQSVSDTAASTPETIVVQTYLRAGDVLYVSTSITQASGGWYISARVGDHRSDFAAA